ncbi:MAG: ABC transporter substrate-binding protein [Brevinema sp.]
MLGKFYWLCAFWVLLLVSCSNTNDEDRDNLVVGVRAEPVSLYPYGANDNASARVVVQIYNRLIEKDKLGQFHPSLASEWILMSPTILQMKIRQGVLFHNDELLTVEDIKFSLETMMQSPEVKHIASPMKEVQIIDSNTIHIILKEPFAPILAHLAHPAASIVQKKTILAAEQNLKQMHPIGTGPFKLVEWNRGQNIILEKFSSYWDKQSDIKSIEFRVIPEDSTRTIALESGDIDIAYDIPTADLESVRNNPSLKLIEQAIPRIEYLGFNIEKNSQKFWKNVKVREAVALAIDIPGIINSVLFGAGTPASSIISEGVVGYYPGLPPLQRNVNKAKQLLAEVGIPSGTKINLWTTEGERQKIAEIIKENLREIGLNVTISIYEWGRFLDGTAKGEHDMFLLGWTTITGDADYGIYNLVHSDAFGAVGNRSFYSNRNVDKLLDLARKEILPQQRDLYYKEIQEILYKDFPIVPLFYKISNVGLSKSIRGFEFDLSDSHRLQTVYFQ